MAYLKGGGVVEVKTRNGKSIKIGENWYSAFKAVELNAVEVGDEVAFEYIEKESGGTTFLNIKGDVKVVGKGEKQEAQQSAGNRGGSQGRSTRSGGDGTDGAVGYDGDQFRKRSMKNYPVSKTDVDRPIIRQNSLTQANALFASLAKLEALPPALEPEQYADLVIELAARFERYSTGEFNPEIGE
jgi:uncharacterized protein YdaT